MSQSPTTHCPRLLLDLRRALACLYNLPPPLGAIGSLSHQMAHDFLLHLQSRNVRRNIHSRCQRLKQKNATLETVDSSWKDILNDIGSTWLACLALLCQSHGEEGLFSAQTLLHRLRRARLCEAIDVEIENTLLMEMKKSSDFYQQVGTVHVWMPHYLESLRGFSPLLFQLTRERYGTIQQQPLDEDTVKGEISMLAISTIAYMVAHSILDTSHDTMAIAKTSPILSTLGSSLAVIAMRLRYTPTNSATQSQTTTTTPLVTMITHCLATVASASSNHVGHNNNQNVALLLCLAHSLAAIPDTILSSPGGARGKLSVDPKCIQGVHDELRNPTTGVFLVMESIMNVTTPLLEHNKEETVTSICHYHVLSTCERWAKFLPLPLEFLQHTAPLAARYIGSSQQHAVHKPALAFLIAIFESATRPVDQILAFSLGLSPSVDQATKKRQSSKSKKRHKEKLNSSTSDARRQEAHAELSHCGEVACHAAIQSWEPLQAAVHAALAANNDNDTVASEGEGPVGCLCACAHACLPHLVQQLSHSMDSQQLFEGISQAFRHVCSSNNRSIRALSYEPLFTLHSALLQSVRTQEQSPLPADSRPNDAVKNMAVNHLYQCAMHLATSCGYPADYFDHLDLDSDEDLEIERNDVRDILRSIAGSEGGNNTKTEASHSPPLQVSIQLLYNIVEACSHAVAAASSLPPETAVHTFSALAKPINHLASAYAHGYRTEDTRRALKAGLVLLGEVCDRLKTTIPSSRFCDTLPVSRLANLAIASMAPALSTISSTISDNDTGEQDLFAAFQRTLDLAIHSAAISIVHIPELASASILNRSQYDIRGAMRGPGGEDHVGCLALMRLVFESDELATMMMRLSGPTLTMELCNVHQELKQLESKKPPFVYHGPGVTPKSRRILLSTISRLNRIETHHGKIESRDAANALEEILCSCASIIASAGNNQAVTEDTVFRTCEATFDLASFSPATLAHFLRPLENTDHYDIVRGECMNALVHIGVYGYSKLSTTNHPYPLSIQWGRMRAALLVLIRNSACPDLPRFAAEAVIGWNQAECEATFSQCHAGPSSISSIFHDSVIGEDCVPSGAFIRALGEVLEQPVGPSSSPKRGITCTLETMPNLLTVLRETSKLTLRTILLKSPEPVPGSHTDPRPTMSEAWFLTMSSLLQSAQAVGSESQKVIDSVPLKHLLCESCTSAFLILLLPSLERGSDGRTCSRVGMTMDGPHTLAMMQFLERSLFLGPEILHYVSLHMEERMIIAKDSLGSGHCEQGDAGLAALVAGLFRAASGGLPPWAVEDVPKVYAALFHACGKNAAIYGKALTMAMGARLAAETGSSGGVSPGELLAGRFVGSMSEASKQHFIRKALELASKDSAEGWRRFKVILKQACGGKKKASGFNLKPSYTSWDCDRV